MQQAPVPVAPREPQIIVVCGKKRIGKTYLTTQMMDAYAKPDPQSGAPGRRVLIFDVNDEFTQYKAIALEHVALFSVHPIIEIRRIRPFLPTGKKMTLDDLKATLLVILDNFYGGMLLIEDINRYVSDNLPNDLVGSICTNAHHDVDVVLHFQSIGRITPKIWQNLNMLRFHKNQEAVLKHKDKFEDKYTLLQIAENIVNEQFFAGNIRYCVLLNIDEMKFQVHPGDELFTKAVHKYIGQNYRKEIAPMLEETDINTGNKLYRDRAAATQAYIQLAKRIYLP